MSRYLWLWWKSCS